jgi:hypothetical protein
VVVVAPSTVVVLVTVTDELDVGLVVVVFTPETVVKASLRLLNNVGSVYLVQVPCLLTVSKV